MLIAVIITTYNRPDALAAVLEGYLAQSDRNFEVIVADDGSTEDTRKLVDSYRERAQFSISHVWQEDLGFRAAAARNRALATTTADYIVFTDGDCIPLPSFVARHRLLAAPGYFLAGNRLLLSERFTQKVLREKIPIHAWGISRWFFAWMKIDINRILPLFLMPNFGMIRKLAPQRWQGVKTCNLSAWRADLIKVNGLDESYSGWGLEDSDLVVRLLHAGVRHKSARLAAPVLHLWHRENPRDCYDENRKKLNEILHSDRVRALQGVQQYL